MEVQTVILNNATLFSLAQWVVHGLLIGAVFFWIRRDLTPHWVLSIVESDGIASARLITGVAVALFTMFMQAAGRIEMEVVRLNWELVFGLYAVGKITEGAKAFAARPAAAVTTHIEAKKVDATAAGDLNINAGSATPPPETE